MLEFHFAVLAFTGDDMLDLELGLHAQLVGEIVAGEQHETVKIYLVRVAAIVMQFATAAQLGALPPPVAAAVGDLLGFDHVAGRLDFLVGRRDLGFGRLQAHLQPLDLVLLGLKDLPHFLGRRQRRVLGDRGRGQSQHRQATAQWHQNIEFHQSPPQ